MKHTCLNQRQRSGILVNSAFFESGYIEFVVKSVTKIDDCLSLIGQKCNKLLKLDLDIGIGIPISDRFFDIFSKFEDIKELKIGLSIIINTVLSGSMECFKHCKQLKHLVIKYSKFREDFFVNIQTFVPKLQLLLIKISEHFSDSFIKPFYSMKYIQSVEISDEFNFRKKMWYFRERIR